jgi:hypothetical protein
MSETPESATPSVPEIQTRLHDVARMLRAAGSLDPEARHVLAELVDELTAALQASKAPPAEVAQLAASAAQLAEALHHQHDRGLLADARDRLGAAVLRAEASAPVATGLALQLLDTLANIGI